MTLPLKPLVSQGVPKLCQQSDIKYSHIYMCETGPASKKPGQQMIIKANFDIFFSTAVCEAIIKKQHRLHGINVNLKIKIELLKNF